MKLLLDQNLSHRLAPRLAELFPGTKHITDVGLAGATDEEIWRYARAAGYAIISKDSDFMHRSAVRGHPPKVVQLQVGNSTTEEIASFLAQKKSLLRKFLKDKAESLLILK